MYRHVHVISVCNSVITCFCFQLCDCHVAPCFIGESDHTENSTEVYWGIVPSETQSARVVLRCGGGGVSTQVSHNTNRSYTLSVRLNDEQKFRGKCCIQRVAIQGIV